MAIIVVGGHSRNVGKTSIAAAIVACWPQYSWTAVKISAHWHEDGVSPDIVDQTEICHIEEAHHSDRSTDTGRFLASGASRSFWIRIRAGHLEEALPALMPVLHSNPYTIIESNGIVRHIQPDLCLMVLRYDIVDFKKSALKTLQHADAIVAVNHSNDLPPWKGMSSDLFSNVPVFPVTDPQTLSPDLKEFINIRLD